MNSIRLPVALWYRPSMKDNCSRLLVVLCPSIILASSTLLLSSTAILFFVRLGATDEVPSSDLLQNQFLFRIGLGHQALHCYKKWKLHSLAFSCKVFILACQCVCVRAHLSLTLFFQNVGCWFPHSSLPSSNQFLVTHSDAIVSELPAC